MSLLPPTEREYDLLTDTARALKRGPERDLIRHLVASCRGQTKLRSVMVTPKFYNKLRSSVLWDYQSSGRTRDQKPWTKILGIDYQVDTSPECNDYSFEVVRVNGSVYRH